MKLTTRLRQRPGSLHIAPFVDVVLILVLFFLLSSSFVTQSGIKVRLPTTPFTLSPMPDADIVTVSAGSERPQLYVNERKVKMKDLEQALGGLRERDTDPARRLSIILKADEHTPYGVVMRVMSTISRAGFDLALAGAQQSTE